MVSENMVYYGSDIKLSLSLDFGNVAVEDTDFDILFFLGKKSLVLNKSQLIKVDGKTYLACIKNPKTEQGSLRAFVRARFPDEDFEDGIHVVVAPLSVDVRVV